MEKQGGRDGTGCEKMNREGRVVSKYNIETWHRHHRRKRIHNDGDNKILMTNNSKI